MQELTCGQRLTRTILGEKTDRVPFGVGLGWMPWGSTNERWRAESGNPGLDCAKGLDSTAAGPSPTSSSGFLPPFEKTVLDETENTSRCATSGHHEAPAPRQGSMPEFLDYPVKTRDDWERLKEERLQPRRSGAHRPPIGTPSAPTSRDRAKRVPRGHFPYGVFGTPRELMGAEELLISVLHAAAISCAT